MSDIIRLLPKHVANQIAAGEVVQRPSSAVKELLENALDAGAKFIELVIIEAGKSLIRVIDDGKGMSVTDAHRSFERHATSKIEKAEDLFKIKTMGFRGEALASIAAIAQVEMCTRRQQDEVAIRLLIEGNHLKEESFVQANKGTSISVKNIFYNVPARRNFLKSTQIEFRHILDEFHRLALSHPSVRFRMYNNQQRLFDLSSASSRQRITEIFGQKINEQLVPVNEQAGKIKLEGFIAKPSYSKKHRGQQFFFVNHRFIKSPYLHKAVLDAFEGLLPAAHHPSYFIFLEINPEHIDINIHPTKTEVKFDDESALFVILRAAVKRALGQYQVSSTLDFDKDMVWEPSIFERKNPIKTPEITVNRNYNPFKPDNSDLKKQTGKPREVLSTQNLYEQVHQSSVAWEEENIDSAPMLFDREIATDILAFQLHKKYILSTLSSGLIVIDQHRAHKRILYEYFFYLPDKKNTVSQRLLFPVSLSFSRSEILIIQKFEKDLLGMGFGLNFQSDTLLIEAIPANMDQNQINNFFQEIPSGDLPDMPDQRMLLAHTMARTMAIKYGVVLGSDEMNHLIHELFACNQPNCTPSGKKVFVTISSDFIEKQFK